MFRSRKYTVLDSFQFVQKIPATPPSKGILLLDDKILSEIEGPRQRLEKQQKKLKEAQEKEKIEKIERMKQGPAEDMTIAVLKQLLKDKGIAFSSKAKKSELVEIFNTQAGYVTAYDGCFPAYSILRNETKYKVEGEKMLINLNIARSMT